MRKDKDKTLLIIIILFFTCLNIFIVYCLDINDRGFEKLIFKLKEDHELKVYGKVFVNYKKLNLTTILEYNPCYLNLSELCELLGYDKLYSKVENCQDYASPKYYSALDDIPQELLL